MTKFLFLEVHSGAETGTNTTRKFSSKARCVNVTKTEVRMLKISEEMTRCRDPTDQTGLFAIENFTKAQLLKSPKTLAAKTGISDDTLLGYLNIQKASKKIDPPLIGSEPVGNICDLFRVQSGKFNQ